MFKILHIFVYCMYTNDFIIFIHTNALHWMAVNNVGLFKKGGDTAATTVSQ